MKKLLFAAALLVWGFGAWAQCTTTNGTSCACPTSGSTDCDLLPDIIVARDALTATGGYTEYPQYNAGTSQSAQGSDDGRLRLTGSTPNIGFGPMEVRGISKWVCGRDTFTTYPGSGGCPDGSDPKQVVVQRIYHKNGTLMQYSDREAGTMTYHPTHGHQHIDGWGFYTLRLQDPNITDPTKWPVVGKGSKLAFCLLDLSSCNSSTGYCRDSAGTVLNSTNLSNYGLGGGAYGCSNTLQGISAGYVDTYSKSLDGMWVNIPLGTCNGNYYIVVEIDPSNNFREMNENNNVLAVPVTLARQNAAGTGVAEITSNRPPTIITGDTATLTANAGYSFLWSTGETTQSIRVASAGTYSVTVNGPCGTATSAPFTLNTFNPTAVSAPTTTSASRCGTGSVTLTANGTGTINWYSTATGGSPVFTGSSFTTPSLSTSTTYYAENVSGYVPPVNTAGPAANTIGTSANYTGTTSQYLVFDAFSNFTLQSVRVFAATTASRTFTLLDKNLSTVRTTTVSVAAGNQVVTLNWNVPAGDFYRLQVSGAANLAYNTTGVTYPYTIPGMLQINNSSGGHNQYFYCYDWKVKSPDIGGVSARTAATATINANPVVSFTGLATTYTTTSAPVTLTGTPAGGTFSGPGVSGNQFSPSVAGAGGPYTITYSYTAANNCSGSQSLQTTVTTASSYNCGVPTGLTATSITGTSAIIGWSTATAPSFRLRYRRSGSSTYSYKTFTYSGSNTYTLTGLRKSTTYEVGLQTTCTSGASAFSTSITFRTAAVKLSNGMSVVSSESGNCTLYPNPVGRSLTFGCDENLGMTRYDYQVTDIAGRVMLTGSTSDGAVDVEALSAGTYILQVVTTEGLENLRFIKE